VVSQLDVFNLTQATVGMMLGRRFFVSGGALMVQSLVGFGSNTGDLRSWFEQTVGLLERHPQIERLKYSQPVITKAILGESAILEQSNADQTDDSSPASEYLNSVISLETSLDAKRLFELTRTIETELGRVRSGRWTARTVDLDILLFGDQVIEADHLTIPHPRMSFRKFVLQGAVEVAPDMVHPQSGVTLKALWQRSCSGPRKVLWLASAPEKIHEARQVKDGLTKISGGPFFPEPERWEIVVHQQASVTELEELPIAAEEYSLLLYSGSDQEFKETARWFGGPLLNLSNCDSSFLRREIVAAVEAML